MLVFPEAAVVVEEVDERDVIDEEVAELEEAGVVPLVTDFALAAPPAPPSASSGGDFGAIRSGGGGGGLAGEDGAKVGLCLFFQLL